MAVLKITNLTKVFPGTKHRPARKALDGVSFDVGEREFVSVVGPSGCGKSTLLNIVAGVIEPTNGSVQFLKEGETAPNLGYVFQDARLIPWRTVIDNLLYVHEKRTSELRSKLLDYLAMVGLHEFASYYPRQLSGGMRMRVAIARALGVEPDLLIMDEPFSHLDAITARGLRDELQGIWERTKKTVLFVTHDVVEAVQLSDKIIVLTPEGATYREIGIHLPRPRSFTDPAVATKQGELLSELEEMMASPGL